jgi:hypothetical protein
VGASPPACLYNAAGLGHHSNLCTCCTPLAPAAYPRDNKNEFGLGQTPAFVKDGTNFKTGANKDPADGEPRVTPRSLLGGDARAPAGKSTPSQPISPLAVGDGGNKDKTPYVRE